ncbi:hypothetical protein PF001_g33443 [Phytophthora fragariae]|uniref:Uncharacterized protein n=1 Tax=Phytophthora fragariae TaxID=53985 RepID=A0A6A3GZF6_9STRA|nr:hypothetical protein PF003_g30520 [Phytophthora fragariae]KAE8962541.1 hypothetical protein PF011_g29346 [Phytophthora fragariae]KAE9054050.1 hypothetical protein PF006_g33364 [Phytophthora fragariae]KAE9252216.1 hypothetical protein PF001_g33443 [Phytophthora fragariae]
MGEQCGTVTGDESFASATGAPVHFAFRALWHKWFQEHLQRLFGRSRFSDEVPPAWGREGEMGCSCAPGTDAAPCLVSATKTVINIAAPDDLHVYPRSTPSAPDLAAP